MIDTCARDAASARRSLPVSELMSLALNGMWSVLVATGRQLGFSIAFCSELHAENPISERKQRCGSPRDVSSR